jgi:hypothetical protein
LGGTKCNPTSTLIIMLGFAAATPNLQNYN